MMKTRKDFAGFPLKQLAIKPPSGFKTADGVSESSTLCVSVPLRFIFIHFIIQNSLVDIYYSPLFLITSLPHYLFTSLKTFVHLSVLIILILIII